MRMELTGAYDLNRKLAALEMDVKNHKTADKMLKSGGNIVKKQAKENLKSVVGSDIRFEPRSTGQLVKSLGRTAPKTRKSTGGRNVRIGFADPRTPQPAWMAKPPLPDYKFQKRRGKRSYNVLTNAMIANVLEYGKLGTYTDKKGVRRPIQAAKPFMKPAVRQSEKPCVNEMKKRLSDGLKEAGLI